MHKTKIQFWLQAAALSAVLSVATLNSGCVVAAVGAAAGAGTVAWVEGKLVVTLANPYDSVVRASDRTITQLQFVKTNDARDALSATLEARTAEDKKVSIYVKREADNLTRVEIRIGTFGDKDISMTILDHIRSNL